MCTINFGCVAYKSIFDPIQQSLMMVKTQWKISTTLFSLVKALADVGEESSPLVLNPLILYNSLGVSFVRG